MFLHALVSRMKVVWAMAELSALARLMRTRKRDGLRSRDRMFDLVVLSSSHKLGSNRILTYYL